MPIKIPNDLPACATLQAENIFVMQDDIAIHQDIRPLHIAILNLMPTKIDTETQLLRLLSNTPLQVDIDLVQMASHISENKNTPVDHLFKFYSTFHEIRHNRYDGLIITGAPVEHLPFEQVDYWEELCDVMEWSKTHVYSTLHVCWGAQAGLYYHYGIQKYPLAKKMFGIFSHKILVQDHPLLKGFDEHFMVPHSRHTEVRRDDVAAISDLEILTYSDAAGVHMIGERSGRQFFVTGHSEYDRYTLAAEYFRDLKKGLNIAMPVNYFPHDDPSQPPLLTWRCHANQLFSNWLNYCVYQRTPYDLARLGSL